jgi:hypothetical protein
MSPGPATQDRSPKAGAKRSPRTCQCRARSGPRQGHLERARGPQGDRATEGGRLRQKHRFSGRPSWAAPGVSTSHPEAARPMSPSRHLLPHYDARARRPLRSAAVMHDQFIVSVKSSPVAAALAAVRPTTSCRRASCSACSRSSCQSAGDRQTERGCARGNGAPGAPGRGFKRHGAAMRSPLRTTQPLWTGFLSISFTRRG